MLVTGHHVEYLGPIGYDAAVVDAEVWVDQVGGARFSISYRLSDGGTAVVKPDQSRSFWMNNPSYVLGLSWLF